MSKMSRRKLLEQTGLMLAASVSGSFPVEFAPVANGPNDESRESVENWIRSPRLLIAEGFAPPFYPALDYDPGKALAIAQSIEADSLRFPAMSCYVFYPTKTKFPTHPDLGSRDLLKETLELFHKAGLKVVVYMPLNHPFMQVNSQDPNYQDWMKRYPDGSPMVTWHYGFTEYYEGCLNSPIRQQILSMVREVVTGYPVDVVYFDGPYQGLGTYQRFCHCRYCKEAYSKSRGKPIPAQDNGSPLEDEIEYRRWMTDEVIVPFMQEILRMIRESRDVPVLYNNTGLLGKHVWRDRLFLLLDGFMYEHSKTPEAKLFHLRLGDSTGKVIWTYVSSYSVYNQEHLKTAGVCGWYTYPAESQELLMDGMTALAGGAGFVYWGMNRLYDVPDPLGYESGRAIKEIFHFSKEHKQLFGSIKPVAQAAIVVGSQTINWYEGKHFVARAYENYYQGAYQVLKETSYEAEPILDYQVTEKPLHSYKLLYLPNTVCLSDAQCAAISRYVDGGGTLLATHLTSVADEYGRLRKDYGLAEVLGATLRAPEPIEAPELYLRFRSSARLLPQDPQVTLFETGPYTSVLADTYDRGNKRTLGPAVITHPYGRGKAIYIGSGLEAIYEETRMPEVKAYLASLLEPALKAWRVYEVDYRPGLMPHYAASEDAVVLHLLANTGDNWKKLNVRERYLPIENVRVRLRLPKARQVKSVKLLRAAKRVDGQVRGGWVELVVPHVLIHEAIQVELA